MTEVLADPLVQRPYDALRAFERLHEPVVGDQERALSAVVARRARSSTGPPVVLAAVDQERHVLPLQAIAAALAEHRRSSVLLGSVPTNALSAAVDKIGPLAVFVWAHVRPGRRAALPVVDAAHAPPPRVVVGGRGWTGQRLPVHVARAESLADAMDALLHPAEPGFTQ